MRSIVFATLGAAGIGLMGSAASAAPAPTGLSLNPDSSITQVQHWRRGSRRHYRGASRGWRNCHVRRWSRWHRC